MYQIKGYVGYIFALLFFKSKREYLWNLGKCFLFQFREARFVHWDIHILGF